MNQCVKCGKQIPKGELFCVECSLNPGSSLFEPTGTAPTGRMQAPMPRSGGVAVAKKEKKQKNTGLKIAFGLVSLCLVMTIGFVVWQYSDLQEQRSRLEIKEADMLLREKEHEELQAQLEHATAQLDETNQMLQEKEQEIASLRSQLSGSQNYAGAEQMATQAELDRLMEENRQLLLLEEELEAEIKGLTAALNSIEVQTKKAEFMDQYVVFVKNDGSRVYHTYDCTQFDKKNFWAYSRGLAEYNGFHPCSTCGGTAK